MFLIQAKWNPFMWTYIEFEVPDEETVDTYTALHLEFAGTSDGRVQFWTKMAEN